MARRTAKVHQPAFSQHDHAVTRWQRVAVNLWLDLHLLNAGGVLQPGDIDLKVKVPDVADDGVVGHLRDMLTPDHVAAAGRGHEDLPLAGGLFHGGHFIALHRRLQGVDGVDLGDDYPGPQRLHGMGTALADVAIACHHHHFASHHDVSGSLDAVGQALAAAVEVVELALGTRVVDVDRWKLQLARLGHLIEPVDAGGGFFGEALNAAEQFRELVVNHGCQVPTVIQNHVERLTIGEE